MQDSNAHNDVLSNSKKILPKAQKLLLLASVRNDSLTLREYRNVLAVRHRFSIAIFFSLLIAGMPST